MTEMETAYKEGRITGNEFVRTLFDNANSLFPCGVIEIRRCGEEEWDILHIIQKMPTNYEEFCKMLDEIVIPETCLNDEDGNPIEYEFRISGAYLLLSDCLESVAFNCKGNILNVESKKPVFIKDTRPRSRGGQGWGNGLSLKSLARNK